MNHLKVQSKVDLSLNQIVTEILIDGKPFTDFKKNSYSVDLSALELSIKESGKFYIITCICGYPNCAGIKKGIQVSHEDDCIQWKSYLNNEVKECCFNPIEYQIAVTKGIDQLKELMVKHNVEVAPEINKFTYS